MSNADTTALRPLVVTETITYRNITLGLPDAGITVLVALTDEASEPTAMAYLDDSGWIECATGENITRLVTHWAEQPQGARFVHSRDVFCTKGVDVGADRLSATVDL